MKKVKRTVSIDFLDQRLQVTFFESLTQSTQDTANHVTSDAALLFTIEHVECPSEHWIELTKSNQLDQGKKENKNKVKLTCDLFFGKIFRHFDALLYQDHYQEKLKFRQSVS